MQSNYSFEAIQIAHPVIVQKICGLLQSWFSDKVRDWKCIAAWHLPGEQSTSSIVPLLALPQMNSLHIHRGWDLQCKDKDMPSCNEYQVLTLVSDLYQFNWDPIWNIVGIDIIFKEFLATSHLRFPDRLNTTPFHVVCTLCSFG